MALLPGDAGILADPEGSVAVRHLPQVADLVREHAPCVGRSLRYLGVPEADVEDAAQEVFLVIHRRLADFEGRSSMRTWIYGICLRVAQGRRRKASLRREIPCAEPPDAPQAAEQEGELERQRARQRLQLVLDSLDEAKRAVFVLYEIEQMTMKQVAEAVGCPLQTAYSRHQAARAQVLAAFERLRAEQEPSP